MAYFQQINTTVEREFGDDKMAFLLYALLLLRASRGNVKSKTFSLENQKNVPIKEKKKQEKRLHSIYKVKKGNTIFGRESYAPYFGCKPFRVVKALERLDEVYGKVTRIVMGGRYTIVTNNDYVVDTTSTKGDEKKFKFIHTQLETFTGEDKLAMAMLFLLILKANVIKKNIPVYIISLGKKKNKREYAQTTLGVGEIVYDPLTYVKYFGCNIEVLNLVLRKLEDKNLISINETQGFKKISITDYHIFTAIPKKNNGFVVGNIE